MEQNQTYKHIALPSGTMLQEYRLEKVVGHGSFGIVYVAKNTFLPEIVAIKEFLPDELANRIEGTTVIPKSSDMAEAYQEVLNKFLDEARLLYQLAQPVPHKNIVRVMRYIEANGTGYMVMDYEKGRPLSELLDTPNRTLPEKTLREILFPLLDGLETVHNSLITHRDIKPANILIRSDGSPVLIDFGAARQKKPDGQKSQFAVFTPDYAAPEQYFDIGEQGPWTDIFAMGATLYRAVTGEKPTNASARMTGKPFSMAVDVAKGQYSPSFLTAIDKALAINPEDRPQSIAEWRTLFDDTESKTIVKPVKSPPIKPAEKVINKKFSKSRPKVKERHYRLSLWIFSLVLISVGSYALFVWLTTKPVTTIKPSNRDTTIHLPSQNKIEVIDTDKINKRIAKLVDTLPCAKVNTHINDNHQLVLNGYISSQQDFERIQKLALSLPGVKALKDNLIIHPKPFCEIIDFLAAYQTDDDLSNKVTLLTNNANNAFKEGDLLIVTANTPTTFSGYLYVDFFDSAGDVIHMLPSPIASDNKISAGQKTILGDNPCPKCYEVSPPHGKSLIVAIASTVSLYNENHPEVENMQDYLPGLEFDLKKARSEGASIFTSFKFITTSK